MSKKAVVLLSGGIDSTVAAYIARKDVGKKGELDALTFNYGQKHSKEVECAIQQSLILEAKKHIVLPIALNMVGGSSLVGEGDIPTDRGLGMKKAYEKVYGPNEESSFITSEGATLVADEIPSTWVPQRNSIFLALAFAYAETVGAGLVYTGFNIRDYSGYPDCRPEFVEQMQRALNLASKRFVETGEGIGIICPLMHLHKSEIVLKGIELGVDFSMTWSCYMGREKACGVCDSCRIRLEAFKKAGLWDPLIYEISRL